MHFSTSTFAAAAVFSLANAAVMGKRALSGEATVYGGNLAGGSCSFSTYTLPSGIFGTALTDSMWDNAANCGRCVSITGPTGTKITAMVVDQCPGCGTNHLDLFPDAFAKLDPTPGIIPTTWDFVDCGITTPLQLHNKEGVSAFWFSMQVVNANKGVKSLEVSTNGGSTWQATTRQSYNFFENAAGFGTTTVDVRITSIDGETVVQKNVNVAPNASTTCGGNFGSSSGSSSAVSEPVASSTFAAPVAASEPSPAVVSTPETTSQDAAVSATASSFPKPTSLVFTPKPTNLPEIDDACELV